MKVALGQFAVSSDWEENLAVCLHFMKEAEAGGADLLVLPEGVLARNVTDPKIVLKSAQPLDGPFVSALCRASEERSMTVVTTVHTPTQSGRTHNTLIAVRGGDVVEHYRKLHLYDAFAEAESDVVEPGLQLPPIMDVAGLKVGMMTCYDVRFPELARRLAVDGAEVILLPAAWVRGPRKEAHWETLITARALENTCYMVAVGECGPGNIGDSMVVDPLGLVVVRAGEREKLLFAELEPNRIAHARTVLPALKNRRFARPELEVAEPSVAANKESTGV